MNLPSHFFVMHHPPNCIPAAISDYKPICSRSTRVHKAQPATTKLASHQTAEHKASLCLHVQISCLDCTIASRADLPKVFSNALRTSDMMRERLAKAKLAAAAMAAK